MSDFDVNSVPSSEAEVDQLLSAIESPSHETGWPEAPHQPEPQQETAQTQEQTDQTAAPVEQPAAEEQYTINWRGQERKVTREQLINYAQQAYDYNEKMRDFKVQQQLFEKSKLESEGKYKTLEEQLNRYREVDEYIKKDPEWWNFVQSQYSQKLQEQGQTASPYAHPVIQKLETKVEELAQHISAQKEREKLLEQSKQDEELDSHVRDYQKQFPQFDWKSLDANGLDLEKRILQHAIDNKIGTFRAAANDYLFDEHLKRRELKAKEETGKEIKKAAKLGLGPVTDKPKQIVERARNVRSTSYDDLAEQALKELGY